MGGGLDLALACQRRIAGPHALFGHRGAALGLITGWGGTQRLPRLIGKSRALQMFLAAEKVHAPQALQIGLVDAIADDPVKASAQSRAELSAIIFLMPVPLPPGDQKLVQIIDAALADTARRSGEWLVCKLGCTQCCIGVFAINQLDVLRLQHGLAELEADDPARAARVKERALALG